MQRHVGTVCCLPYLINFHILCIYIISQIIYMILFNVLYHHSYVIYTFIELKIDGEDILQRASLQKDTKQLFYIMICIRWMYIITLGYNYLQYKIISLKINIYFILYI